MKARKSPRLKSLADKVPAPLARIRAGARVVARSKALRDASGFATPANAVLIARHGIGVHSLMALRANAHPDRLAACDTRQRLTYQQCNERINGLANALLNELGPGKKRVAICLENRVEYLVTWLALFRLGWASVHVSPSSAAEDMAYQLENSEAAAIVGSSKSAEAVLGAIDIVSDSLSPLIIWMGDASPNHTAGVDFDDLIASGGSDYPDANRDGGGENVVYTSGTTGKPKGAVRDFGNIGNSQATVILERLPIGPEEQHLVVSRLYHSAGQVFALLTLALGGTLHIRDKYDPEETLKTICEERITSMFFVPTMLRQLLDVPDELFMKYPPADFRWMISGAAPFPHELRERAIERFGAGRVHDFYGASELGWVTLVNGHEMLQRKGSVGTPIQGQQVRVVDGNGHEVPANEVGLIQVANEQIMDGYLNNQDATDEIHGDGWVTVEDTGYVDEDGYLYIVGRERDMVISGGVNLYPAEIEDALSRHEAIHEIAVIGVPDEKWGERLEAVVVYEEDVAKPDVDTLVAWAKDRLASYKVPRAWHAIDELPRNDVGKVLKNQLRDTYGG